MTETKTKLANLIRQALDEAVGPSGLGTPSRTPTPADGTVPPQGVQVVVQQDQHQPSQAPQGDSVTVSQLILGAINNLQADLRTSMQTVQANQQAFGAGLASVQTDVANVRAGMTALDTRMLALEQRTPATPPAPPPAEVLVSVVQDAVNEGVRRAVAGQATRVNRPPARPLEPTSDVHRSEAHPNRALARTDGWISVRGLVKIITALAALAGAVFTGIKIAPALAPEPHQAAVSRPADIGGR